MPNNNYSRGAAFERRLVLWLRERGWVAGRSAGSHGTYDVHALRERFRPCLFQCKDRKAKPTKEELQELVDDARKCAGLPYFAIKKRGKEDFFDLFYVMPDLSLHPTAPLSLEQPF